MKRALVIGAGLGGLSAACRLAKDGFEVSVLEKNDSAGGKVGRVNAAGYSFDTGASLVTMPHIFEDLFEYCGQRLSGSVDLVQLDPVCRYIWKDGERLDAFSDPERTGEEIARIAPEDADAFGRYLEDSREKYEIAERTFLSRSLNDLPGLIRPSYLPDLFRISSFSTLHNHNSRYFSSTKILQLFNRYATYNGSSPYRVPATFALIPYAEMGLGAWYPMGGIHRIPLAIKDLAETLGVNFEFGTEVERLVIESGKAVGTVSKGGEVSKADVVVVNADAVEAYRSLIPAEHRRIYTERRLSRIEPSCSGFVLLLGVRKKFDQLVHHNIFFSDDYRSEFESIFGTRTIPEDPTIYVCATSRTDETQAPEGCENLFVLVNAPYTGVVDWESEKQAFADRVISTLEENGLEGLRDAIEYREIITPEDFEARYRANRGSIYGVSSNGILSAFLRVPNKAKDIENLYFVGGTTHPGGGMPLVLLSGKFASEMISREMGG